MEIHGINFEIDWVQFKPGRSFFIPCLDTSLAKIKVLKICKRLKYSIEIRIVIENGVRGLRVWRIR